MNAAIVHHGHPAWACGFSIERPVRSRLRLSISLDNHKLVCAY